MTTELIVSYATYLREIMMLLLVIGFVMIYRKAPSFYSIGLVVGSTMHLASIALGYVYELGVTVDIDGNITSYNATPAWVFPLSQSFVWLGSMILVIGLLGFAYKLQPQNDGPAD